MKIAIIGPGAIGLFLASRLQDAGQEVWLLDHRPERAAALRRHGCRVVALTGEEQEYFLNVVANPELIGPCDLVLVLVKAHQTAAAAPQIPPLLKTSTVILTLQNGIGNLEALAAVVGWSRLAAGVAFLGVTRLGTHLLRLAGEGPIVVGRPPGSAVAPAELAQVCQLFTTAGFACDISPDILATLWDKLLLNAGINPVTALTRLTNGELLQVPEAWAVAVAAVQEAVEVAKALHLAVSAEPIKRLRQVCEATAANRSSMLQDILAPRQTEIEALNGQIVAHGRRLGLATPVNAALTNLIKALEFSLLAPGRPQGEKQGKTGG